ncbi:MAG: carbohydrate binding family 9 domain-containing protein [Myxococcales bacterium]|nr:carbohydrate binding family 9 domain-containing protein [Myxococcales bacterium]
MAWLFVLLFFVGGAAWAGEARRAHAVFVQEGPVLDGLLEDPVWQLAEPVGGFTQIEPDEGAPPTQRTEVRFLTDHEYLYVAFRGWDTDPSAIVANRLERDDFFFFNDNFGMVLDTFHDHRNGYFFQVNPLGGRRDGTFEGVNFEDDWDGIWDAAARIDDEGWTAEIRIPYQTLSFRKGADTWGLNMVRRIRRRTEEDRWADLSLERMLIDMSRAGVLTGVSVARQGLGLEIVPSLALQRIDDPLASEYRNRATPTLDAFYKVLPSLTASLTVNNDFATAAVDEERVNLTRFDLLFPEKRAFFQQDSGIFNFGGLTRENGIPFFSRRIGLDAEGDNIDLLAGLKFTGRVGPYNLGFLDVQAESHGGVRSRNLAVARISRNVLDESTVGFIATNGDPLSDDDNSLVGADFNFRSNSVVSGRVVGGHAWLQRSITQGESGGQAAYGGQINYPNDRINWLLRFKEIQRNFDPALGFVNRKGIRQYDGDYRYRWRPGTWLRTVDTRISGRLVTDTHDRVESGRVALRPLAVSDIVGDFLELRYRHYFERLSIATEFEDLDIEIPAGSYHFDEAALLFDSSQNRPVYVFLEFRYGSFFNGHRLAYHPRIEWRPSGHVMLGLEYEENRIELDAKRVGADGSLGPLERTRVQTRIARVRLNLAFTPNLSWNTFVQYNDVTDTIGIQSRFNWIIVPGRDLLLVFNQGLDTQDDRVRWGRTDSVIKLSWTFRF